MADLNATKAHVLHVGCGRQTLDDLPAYFNDGNWNEIRLDIDEEVAPDIVGTILDMGLIDDGAVGSVFSSHNIEHVYPHEVNLALREFHRVLSHDGVAVIRCPDLESVAQAVAKGALTTPLYTVPAGPVSALDILYGFQPSLAEGQHYMAHRTGFTAATLADHLLAAGFRFVVVARDLIYGLHAIAYKQPREAASIEGDCEKCFPPLVHLMNVAVFPKPE